ncbi:hypothetical protein P3S67_015571 [Capsicum chacoense]
MNGKSHTRFPFKDLIGLLIGKPWDPAMGKFQPAIRNESGESEEKDEILHARRRKSNPRLNRREQRGTEVEVVAAGCPNWLVAVSGKTINGWLPKRADNFEKIDKIGCETYSNNVYKHRDVLLNKVAAMKKVRFDNLNPESVKVYGNRDHHIEKAWRSP